jgi:hypothetical protein
MQQFDIIQIIDSWTKSVDEAGTEYRRNDDEGMFKEYTDYLLERFKEVVDNDEIFANGDDFDLSLFLDETAREWADSVVPVYHDDILNWYISHSARMDWADQAMKEFETDTMVKTMNMGFYLYMREIITDPFNDKFNKHYGN